MQALRAAAAWFNFRVTPASMVVLALATVAYSAFWSWIALKSPGVAACIQWLRENFGPGWMVFTICALRVPETLLFIMLPFRAHLWERPMVIWMLLSASFVGMFAPGAIRVGLDGQHLYAVFYLITLVHFMTWAVWGMFLWNNNSKPSATPQPTPEGRKGLIPQIAKDQ